MKSGVASSKPAQSSGFSHVPAYPDYQMVRIRPIIHRLCLGAIVLMSLLLVWDFSSDAPTRNLAMLWRMLSILPVIAAVVIMRRRLFERYFVDLLLVLSLLSFCCLTVNFILLPERTPYIPVILFFFNMGFLILAPLVNDRQLLLNLAVPLPLLYLLLMAFDVHGDYFLQFLLHVFPLLIFLNYTAWHMRSNSRAGFELFRRNLELATFDSLTQLLNRRAWEQQSLVICRKAKRENKNFAILITDIDFFKKVNDTWGHPAGDQTLKKLAVALRSTLRDYDIIGRFGGEEFVVSVSNLSREQILALGERLRQVVENLEIYLDSGPILRVTTSVGIGIMEESDPDMDAVLIHSDLALYQAKQNGRNRVEVYERVIPEGEYPCVPVDPDTPAASL